MCISVWLHVYALCILLLRSLGALGLRRPRALTWVLGTEPRSSVVPSLLFLKSGSLVWAVADLTRFNFYFKRTVRYNGFCCRWYLLEEKMAILLFHSVAWGLTCTDANWYSRFGINMSEFRDELTRLAAAERDKREASVLSNPGMHFPWLQERIETVGKWTNIEAFHFSFQEVLRLHPDTKWITELVRSSSLPSYFILSVVIVKTGSCCLSPTDLEHT